MTLLIIIKWYRPDVTPIQTFNIHTGIECDLKTVLTLIL